MKNIMLMSIIVMIAPVVQAGPFDSFTNVLKDVPVAKKVVRLEEVTISAEAVEKFQSAGYVDAGGKVNNPRIKPVPKGLAAIKIDGKQGYRTDKQTASDIAKLKIPDPEKTIMMWEHAKRNGWGDMEPLPPETLEEALRKREARWHPKIVESEESRKARIERETVTEEEAMEMVDSFVVLSHEEFRVAKEQLIQDYVDAGRKIPDESKLNTLAASRAAEKKARTQQ